MAEQLTIRDFTDEEYIRYMAVALPLIRDGRVFPIRRFENLIGLPPLSAFRFLHRLREDDLITGGRFGGRKAELTPLGYRAVQHIVTVKDGIALLEVKIKIPEELR